MPIAGQIASFLRSGPVGRVHFVCGATEVPPGGYLLVARAIEQGRVRVLQMFGDSDGEGEYLPDSDTLHVQAPLEITKPTSMALVVHEATHVLQDLAERGMYVLDAECAAYVAQALYLRLCLTPLPTEALQGVDPATLTLPQLRTYAVFTRADAIAARLVATPAARVVREEERAALRTVIASHHAYAHRVDDVVDFGGLAGC